MSPALAATVMNRWTFGLHLSCCGGIVTDVRGGGGHARMVLCVFFWASSCFFFFFFTRPVRNMRKIIVMYNLLYDIMTLVSKDCSHVYNSKVPLTQPADTFTNIGQILGYVELIICPTYVLHFSFSLRWRRSRCIQTSLKVFKDNNSEALYFAPRRPRLYYFIKLSAALSVPPFTIKA